MDKTMTELEQIILQAQDAYYNGTPLMSDADFDELYDKLIAEQPDSEILKRVGVDNSDGFEKVIHKITMGSQNKANTLPEMEKWLKKINGNIVATHKMDGASICLTYEKGKLVDAVTRGNAVTGDRITSNAMKMNFIPKVLKEEVDCIVRGEVLLSKDNKDKFYPEAANCRNQASGLMKRLDGEGSEHLDVVVYELFGDAAKPTQAENLEWLETQGFTVADWEYICDPTAQQCMDLLNFTFSEEEKAMRKYDIDGIVFKQDNIDYEDLKKVRSDTQIALKPPREKYITTIKDIEWSLSDGTYTPIAIVEGLVIAGTFVQRASLSNVDMLEKLEIEIGDQVEIIKAGLIIPKVTANVSRNKKLEKYV
jgi:DNA ligase (NAD+)